MAATCKHHGINKIATFDSDFERVDLCSFALTNYIGV
ncbi:MAG: PIN domain-containing protein [Euryarchaeota archaeon]|nr:PIN domain-containing protein [Euryarchaeota archaeon]